MIVVVSALVLGTDRTSHPGAIGLTGVPLTSIIGSPTSPVSSSSAYYETVSGCAEDAHDHNRDVDPPGYVDQEDDECLPAQHAPRLPDGAPAR